MKLQMLAAEYRKSAGAVRERVQTLKKRAEEPEIKYDERFMLNRRITELELIMAETMRTAYYLENYYRKAGGAG